jgi:biotin synthase
MATQNLDVIGSCLDTRPPDPQVRHDWSLAEVEDLMALPFADLIFRAQSLHRAYFDPNRVQISRLLSIKTGKCPEDCGYCSQSAHYDTGLQAAPLMDIEPVLDAARQAKAQGASRFCMGTAWRGPSDAKGGRDFERVLAMVEGVKALGLETCATLGLLDGDQANRLKDSGLDYYNHNIDTSPEFYGKVITTRTFQDRLDTLDHVRDAGMKVCCGGILGMGETRQDRARMLQVLANLSEHPESVPINQLIAMPGTPLESVAGLDPFEFVRTVAVARIMMPASHVRLSAGRSEMSDELQSLCFLAGANSIFAGDRLLTADNPGIDHDQDLFDRLGVQPEER